MNEVDEYLANLPEWQKNALARIRAKVKEIIPAADECISYMVPTFKYLGMLCSYAAFKKHCSFFPGKQPIVDCAADLKGFKTSAGTVQFTEDKPIPDAVLERLIRICVERNELKKKKKKA